MKVFLFALVIFHSCYSVSSFSQESAIPDFGDAVPVYNAAVQEMRGIQDELEALQELENKDGKESFIKERRQVLLDRLSAAGERLEGASAEINAFLTDEAVAQTYVKLNIDPNLIASCYQTSLMYVGWDEEGVPDSIRADVAKCEDAVEEAKEVFEAFLGQVTKELEALQAQKDDIEDELRNPALSEAEKKELEDKLAELNRQIKEKEQDKAVAERSLDLMNILELALSLASIAVGVAAIMAGDVGTGAKLIVGGVVGVMKVLDRPATVNRPGEDRPTPETQKVNDELAQAAKDDPVIAEAFNHEVEGVLVRTNDEGSLRMSFDNGRFHVYRASTGDKILTISDENIYDPSILDFALSDIVRVGSVKLQDKGFDKKDRVYLLQVELSNGDESQLILKLGQLAGDMKVTALQVKES